LYNSFFPVRSVRKVIKHNANPWITPAIINSCKAKAKLYRDFLESRSLTDEEKYKNFNRVHVQVVRLAKKKYISVQNIENILLASLRKLEVEGFRVVAYADDVALVTTGKYASVVRDRMQVALQILVEWTLSCGLGVNPSKTEVVLFTRKHRIPDIRPLRLLGVSLQLSEEARYLGLILDRKLT